MIEQSPELRAILERIVAAIERLDGKTVANLMVRDAAMRYIGTDVREWWSGASVADGYPRHVDGFPPISFDTLDIEAYALGEVGWGAVQARTRFGEADEDIVRHSFVFVLDGGIWRIVQWHLSLGTPNVEWVGVELPGVLEELVAEAGELGALPGKDGTVTLMFTDIEDSTVTAAAAGDAAWTRAIDRHQRAIAEVAERHGGTVVKVLGDGAMIVFDSTREAVRAGIEIQRIQGEAGDALTLSVRIGVHVGDAVATESDYYGLMVHKTARITAAASGGEIVISEAVRALVADSREFQFGDPRSVKLKGLDGIHEVTPVLWNTGGS